MSQGKILLFSLELSNKKWDLCFGDGSRERLRSVKAGDLEGLLKEVKKAKAKFALAGDCAVYSGYEAGRDGFWIHRFLEKNGIHNQIMDPGSIEVSPRYRRRKTDPLDARKLLSVLVRKVLSAEKRAFSTVRVPSEKQEDAMRTARERDRLKKESNGHVCRIKSLLVLHGIKGIDPQRCQFDQLKDWQGRALPPGVSQELNREQQRLLLVKQQLRELESYQGEHLKHPKSETEKRGQQLSLLRGVGKQSAWVLSHEFFGWRRFRNRKEVGACAGLVGTPYDSGESRREQGISKAGNRRIRSVMIELAWLWLRYQPKSKLSLWFHQRFGKGGRRMRRVGIVALARKLLVALWKFVEFGECPEGAVLGGAIQ